MSVEIKLTFQSLPDMLAFFANTKTLSASFEAKTVEGAVELPLPQPEAVKAKGGRPRKNVVAAPAQPEVAVGNAGSAVSDTSSQDCTNPSEDSTGANEAEAKEVTGNGASEPEASAPPVTIEMAREALSGVNERLGLEKAKAVLTKFGAARLSDVKAESFAAFIAACAEMA